MKTSVVSIEREEIKTGEGETISVARYVFFCVAQLFQKCFFLLFGPRAPRQNLIRKNRFRQLCLNSHGYLRLNFFTRVFHLNLFNCKIFIQLYSKKYFISAEMKKYFIIHENLRTSIYIYIYIFSFPFFFFF